MSKRTLKKSVENVLAFDTRYAIENRLRFGVEIEFSDVGELQLGGDVDEGRLRQRLIDNHDSSDLINDVACRLESHGFSSNNMRIISRWLFEEEGCDCESFADQHYPGGWESYVDDMVTTALENDDIEDNERETSFQDVDGWRNCEDGTHGIVQEYKTNNPCTFNELKALVGDLFECAGNWCKVPTNGSCHIHVSFPDTHHTCEKQSVLHSCILFSLSQLVPYFPARLWDRLLDENCTRYFNYDHPPTDKYSAVHIHSQGTWEFRLFGHMQTTEDVMECVYIAGQAIINGYRLYQAGANVKDVEWLRTEFRDAIENKRSIPANGYIEECDNYVIELPALEDKPNVFSVLAGGMVHISCREPDTEDSEAGKVTCGMDFFNVGRTTGSSWNVNYAKCISAAYGGLIQYAPGQTPLYIRRNFISVIPSSCIDRLYYGARYKAASVERPCGYYGISTDVVSLDPDSMPDSVITVRECCLIAGYESASGSNL